MWQIFVWLVAGFWNRRTAGIKRSLRRQWARWWWRHNWEDAPDPMEALMIGSVINRLRPKLRYFLAKCFITLSPGIGSQRPVLFIYSATPELLETSSAPNLLREIADAFRLAHYCHQIVIHGQGCKTEMQFKIEDQAWSIVPSSFPAEPPC